MPTLSYQTLQVDNRALPEAGPSPRGDALAASVKLLHKASVALNEFAVSWRVSREIEARYSEIARVMPENGGVLVCVGIQEWDTPDIAGTRAQSFLSLHVVGGGTHPEPLWRRYLSRPQLVQGAAEGWRRRDVFVWVTR